MRIGAPGRQQVGRGRSQCQGRTPALGGVPPARRPDHGRGGLGLRGRAGAR